MFSLFFIFGRSIELFDDGGEPIPALVEILKIATQIRPSEEKLHSRKAIRNYLLTKWCHTKNNSFIPPSKERDEFAMNEPISSKQGHILLDNFRKLGMIDSYVPEATHDVCCIALTTHNCRDSFTYFEAAKDFYIKNKHIFKNKPRIADNSI